MRKGRFYRKFIRPVKHAIGFVIIKIGIWKIRVLPRRITLFFMKILGVFSYYIMRRDRKIALKNIGHVFPEKDSRATKEFAKTVFKHTAMNLGDAVRAERIVEAVPRLWRVEGEEYFQDYIKTYGGGIVITGHIGCFELIPGICAKLGYKVGVVGRQLYDRRVDEILVKQREKMGVKVVPSDASPRELIKLIRDDYVFGILMDTNTTSVDGRPAEFFGHETRTISGPIALSLLLDRPPLPMSIYREKGDRFLLKIWPPIEIAKAGDKEQDIIAGLSAANSMLEQIIMRCPEEWIWFHPKFRDIDDFYDFL